ncbi:replication-relaxation family protein [Kineosporia sp. J2-2]|uniref:Replication-relaxation family protein n=1 Tax=Kineosporia corallincola TaxID=2835133 RepID=A0ABS5TTQ1_9ACTN|nr:replication-relaxation family protein [Kineosporia corallincola]MBT0774178.1 replication-relaxation family protein [Kineosporia corallincola]
MRGASSWLPASHDLRTRDQALLRLLHEHGTLTGPQIERLLFASPAAARGRLSRLRRRGWIDSFRVHRAGRALPAHWVLGEWGSRWAAIHAGDPPPTARQLRTRTEGLAASSQLEHTDGVHDVFVSLIVAARHRRPPHWLGPPDPTGPLHPGSDPPTSLRTSPPTSPGRPTQQPMDQPAQAWPQARLARWWSSARTARAMDGQVRPDGHGVWEIRRPAPAAGRTGPDHEPGEPGEQVLQVGVFLEYDRGTETVHRLAAKLGPYERLLAEGLGPAWPLLIVVPTVRREQHLHHHLDQIHASGVRTEGEQAGPYPPGAAFDETWSVRIRAQQRLVVLTTTLEHLIADPLGASGPVWRPVIIRSAPGASVSALVRLPRLSRLALDDLVTAVDLEDEPGPARAFFDPGPAGPEDDPLTGFDHHDPAFPA